MKTWINAIFGIHSMMGVLMAFFIASCSHDDTVSNTGLKFSADTVRFDTVFTTLGSATKRLIVYNPAKQAVHVNIALEGGVASPFKLNIDGLAANHVEGIEIAAKDSMYIFVEVKVDPQNSDIPVLIGDAVLFETALYRQRVFLEAYGQDVFILRDQTIQSQVWSGEKPYLVYGRLVIDTLETLHIEAGVRVYMHQGAGIYVKGTVVAEGDADSPIVFSGDRLEKMYHDIPGQWGSVIFGTASVDNLLRHVVIRNGTNGLIFGNPEYAQTPVIALNAVTIANMSYAGLMIFASDIDAVNCLIVNCGTYTVGLFCGGTSRFVHCTIANNYSPYIRRRAIPSLVVNHVYPLSGTIVEGRIPANIFLGNTIIYGTMDEEISIDQTAGYSFDHCLLRTQLNTTSGAFTDVLVNTDPLFVAPEDGNFHLEEASPARDAGDMTIDVTITEDLDGNNRIVGQAPDIGAYEWQ